MMLRQSIETHAEAHPFPSHSIIQIWQDNKKWEALKEWATVHPLAGKKVKLINSIPHFSKRTKQMKRLETVKILQIDLLGGVRFTCDHGYWIDIDDIDFDATENMHA